MDYADYKEEIKEIAAHFLANNPTIARLIRMANNNLFYGPTYDNDDGICESFIGACQKIRTALDEAISEIEEFRDVYNHADGEWDTISDNIPGSDADIKREIVGKELYKYI